MNKINTYFSTKNKQLIFQHTITNTPMEDDFKIHLHNYYELYYFISGNVTFYIEGQNYSIKSGDLIIVNSKELHRPFINSDTPYERIILHNKPEYTHFLNTANYDLYNCFEKRTLGYFNMIQRSEVIKYKIDKDIKDIEYHFNKNLQESEIMIFTIFVQLLVKLNAIYSNKENLSMNYLETVNDTTIQSILNYINDNLSKKITLDMLEKEFYITRYYLCRIFKKSTGFTIQEYIMYKRLIKAKELLALGMPAFEVSYLVGFSNYSNFYRLFKKVLGISPRNFTN